MLYYSMGNKLPTDIFVDYICPSTVTRLNVRIKINKKRILEHNWSRLTSRTHFEHQTSSNIDSLLSSTISTCIVLPSYATVLNAQLIKVHRTGSRRWENNFCF